MNITTPTFKVFCLFLFLSFCICFSCKDDEVIIPQDASFNEGDTISVDETKVQQLFPLEAYRNHSTVVYRNEQGQEYTFPIVITETTAECFENIYCNGRSYTRSIINIRLTAVGFPNYEVEFTIEPVVDAEELTFDECIIFSVLEYHRVITEPEPDPFDLFPPFGRQFCDNFYQASGVDAELLDVVFEDVEFGDVPRSHDGLAKAYYTTDLGLAAFHDEFDVLYIFDRFE